jgi:hypothetical protein
MPVPIDTTTGLQSGGEVHTGKVLVLKGYLVTLANGFESRLGPDKGRALTYAMQQRGSRVEPLFVERDGGDEAR